MLRRQNRLYILHIDLSNAAQYVLDVLLLKGQLCSIFHMLPLAAATHPKMCTKSFGPVCRRTIHLRHARFVEAFLFSHELYVDYIARHPAFHKQHHTIVLSDAFPFLCDIHNLQIGNKFLFLRYSSSHFSKSADDKHNWITTRWLAPSRVASPFGRR